LTAALRALLAQPPAPGTNSALVTHTLNIQSALFLDIEEGEAVVVSPDGAGSFAVIGRIPAERWDLLDTATPAAQTGAPALRW
jgi:hypothetical protein